MVGHPGPVVVVRVPEAGLPVVVVIDVSPAAGHPKVILAGARAARACLQALRRGRQILHLRGLPLRPEAGNPLVPLLYLVPVSGHPAAIRRRLPPDSADPDEIAACLFPSPIARN